MSPGLRSYGSHKFALKLLIFSSVSIFFAGNANAQNTLQGLGFIGGGGANPFSGAGGLSDDGSVVVGASSNAADQIEAFRWTSAGMVGLGFLPGGTESIANSVSRNGTVPVGRAYAPGFQFQAVSWNAGGVITPLGFLGGTPGDRYSEAYAANLNGSVIVGYGVA